MENKYPKNDRLNCISCNKVKNKFALLRTAVEITVVSEHPNKDEYWKIERWRKRPHGPKKAKTYFWRRLIYTLFKKHID